MPEPYTDTNAKTTLKMFHAKGLHWYKVDCHERMSESYTDTKLTATRKCQSYTGTNANTTLKMFRAKDFTLAQSRLPLENAIVLHRHKRDVRTMEKMLNARDFTQGQIQKYGRVLHWPKVE